MSLVDAEDEPRHGFFTLIPHVFLEHRLCASVDSYLDNALISFGSDKALFPSASEFFQVNVSTFTHPKSSCLHANCASPARSQLAFCAFLGVQRSSRRSRHLLRSTDHTVEVGQVTPYERGQERIAKHSVNDPSRKCCSS